jgi:glucokinase
MKLVADIGGTNSRLAIVRENGPDINTIRSFRNSEFGRFDDILETYLSEFNDRQPAHMVIAVAGPVRGNKARLTNLDWEFSGQKLAQRFRSSEVEIINDLTALGYSVPNLRPGQLNMLVAGINRPDRNGQSLVVGIGTGFNVSPVIQFRDQLICPSVEAGHPSMPTLVARKMDNIAAGLSDKFTTIEHCFSGRGLQQFIDQLVPCDDNDATALVANYGQADYEKSTDAIDRYVELLGYLLCELSLSYLPTDGIFLAGGVARSVLSTAAAKHCVSVLSQSSRFHIGQFPVWVIADDTAALTGWMVPQGVV